MVYKYIYVCCIYIYMYLTASWLWFTTMLYDHGAFDLVIESSWHPVATTSVRSSLTIFSHLSFQKEPFYTISVYPRFNVVSLYYFFKYTYIRVYSILFIVGIIIIIIIIVLINVPNSVEILKRLLRISHKFTEIFSDFF